LEKFGHDHIIKNQYLLPSFKAINMSMKPSFHLLELQEPFGKILSTQDFGAATNDIAELI